MVKKVLSRQLITRLILKLISYQAKRQLGEDVIADLKDVLGDEFQEKLASQLGWNQEKIIEAFEDADKQFIKQCKNDILKQAVKSQPLARIPSLEKFAITLPQTLDDEGLLEILEQRFRDDWSNLPESQIASAARLYRRCLDKSLTSKANQLPETSIRILSRIDIKVELLSENTKKLIALYNKSEKSRRKRANYQKYLNDIIHRYSIWQKIYTPMFANFERLTIYAQVVESEDTPKPLTTLINESSKLVILGVAGSGKTTTLSKVALENAKKARKKTGGAFIPILLQLRNYRGSLSELFDGQLKPWGIEVDTFEKDLRLGKFLLIFDGINEIPPNIKDNGLAELRELLSNYGKNRFLFTSRNTGFQNPQLSSDDQSSLPVCEIQPLYKDQIIEYTKRYLGTKTANVLITQLGINDPDIWRSERSLAQLVRIPLWLQMIIVLFKKIKRVPRNEGELMLQFVNEILLEREPSKAASVFSADIKKEILSTVAYAMHEKGLTGEAPKRYIYPAFLKGVSELIQPFETKKAEDLWKEIQNNHLLVEEDGMVSWPHPLFQELFVGLNLRDLCFDDLWQPRFVEIEIRFDDVRVKSKWDREFEAGTTMLGIVPEKYRPEALVAIGFYNPALAYEAYLKMEPEFNLDLPKEFLQRGLFYLCSPRKGKEHRNLVKTISKMGGDSICSILTDVASDCLSWEGREQALYEIWSHCKEENFKLLEFLQIRAKQDSADQVRIAALSFLMRLKQNWDFAIPFVITRLFLESNEFEKKVRRLITSEAMQFALFSKTLIATSLSQNSDTRNRMRATWMLGEFLPANSSAKSALIKITRNTSNDVKLRKEAIHALRGFCSTNTINFLGEISCNENNSRLRREALLSLTACSDYKALTFILSALKDTDLSVIETSIDSLVRLAESLPVIEKLQEYCRKNDVVLRQRAINALSKICLFCDQDTGNASAKVLLNYKSVSDKHALKDIAIALKAYYPSESAEVAKRLFLVSSVDERQELNKLFDESTN